MAGTSIRRLATSLERWKASILLSIWAIRGPSSAYSRPSTANISLVRAGRPASAAMRASSGSILSHPLAGAQAELGGMATDSVGELRAPLDQALAHAQQHLRRRLLDTLDGHQPLLHLGPAHRLADRLGVGLVVLVAADIGLHVLRRDHHQLVAQLLQLPRPVVGR